MAVDTSAGFRFRGRVSKMPPTIQTLTIKDTETLTKGDLVTLDGGEIDLAATNDSTILGVVLNTAAGTDSTTTYEVIVDADAIYGVYDANARVKGATLDISGTTGAMTVTTSSNADVTVYAPSSADEETLVMITHGEHADN
jgi:hypothetical protein